ncbi:glycerophosphoryl diester phosphodiesterase [Strigomonas culicis]|uniref:Glycerophosphoryl diester phosphodiesterase n=1 Tax=Strigomonas culicis TaxID=28005 RepID=S9W8W5_9TRYP|nr:glycerophosphoryl diester phosphodiesterase [Strigomonas culicis]EPY33323.1 glycerophosphoryl diester phosphodiesterase [Strigomonas culicis]EPY35671.1 glycerophosphoryl diester phosphodiesterase [Strigomonas culicis]|eukprot:EPY28469.1 glycerophosphoryl diester phosphodiesterase [Strigomonas culicis]
MLSVDQSAINSPNISHAPAKMVKKPSTYKPSGVVRKSLQEIMPTFVPSAPGRLTFPQNQVRVACHRGDWRNYVENTLEAVDSCIRMGADVIEVDVWKTSDGVLILMHDDTLDRCTDGTGKICDHTLEEIRELFLKDGLGNMTEFKVPTVEEMLELVRGRDVMINLDKADLYLQDVYDLLQKTGTQEQVMVKSATPYMKLWEKYGPILDELIFMPILDITPDTTGDEIKEAFAVPQDVYEVNFEKEDTDKLELIKELAARHGAVLWINTIWPTTCGGHSDDHALKDKEGTWGYVVDQLGGGILQTDRPLMLLEYLKSTGKR